MDDTAHLLTHLHRGGAWAYLWTNPGKRSLWAPTGQSSGAPVERSPLLIRVPAGRVNVYFGVHPATQIPWANSRGQPVPRDKVRAQVAYIAAINCAFAEFDAKDFVAADLQGGKDAIRAHLATLATPPSVVVDSGGGYHVYWLLDEPLILDNDVIRARAARFQREWVTCVRGDGSAKDLARMLRLPGTLNHKYQPPHPVSFVAADFDHIYRLADLEETARPDGIAEGKSNTSALSEANELEVSRTIRSDRLARARSDLARLALWRRDNYAAWLEVGMALAELGRDGLTLWDHWSRGSSKYRPGVCREKWATFRPRDGVTLSSLTYWARVDSLLPLPARLVQDPQHQQGNPDDHRQRASQPRR
jgi:hypothetical protein